MNNCGLEHGQGNSFLEPEQSKEEPIHTAWATSRRVAVSLLMVMVVGCCSLAAMVPTQSDVAVLGANSTISLGEARKDCSSSIDGGGWTLVRHSPPSGWGPFCDHLAGTAYLGPVGGPDADLPWTVPWTGSPSKFLFSFGDCSNWLVTTPAAIYGQYQNDPRQILSSSLNSCPYKARWYNRKMYTEDPWISVKDHPAIIVYGESWSSASHGCGSCKHEECRVMLKWHKGANVYIKWD